MIQRTFFLDTHSSKMMGVNLKLFLLALSIFPFKKFVIGLNMNSALIENYFTKYQPVKELTLFSCSNLEEQKNLAEILNDKAISWKILNPNVSFNITEILHWQSTYPSGVYLDCSCDEYEKVLEQASRYKYFNVSYFWLIEGDFGQTPLDVLDSVFHIHLNCAFIAMYILYDPFLMTSLFVCYLAVERPLILCATGLKETRSN